MRDSYEIFLSKGYLTKDQLFDFGLSETIYVDVKTASEAWGKLKCDVMSGEKVFIRGFGKNASGTHLFLSLYRYLYGNQSVIVDPTNNAEPTKLIRTWTGFSKNGGAQFKKIRNYQISHVFGRTKNAFCFTAPWNIVYIPKIIDPLTGHEAKGDLAVEFAKVFRRNCYTRFEPYIEEYNEIVTGSDFKEQLRVSIELMTYGENTTKSDQEKLLKVIASEFSPITVDVNA